MKKDTIISIIYVVIGIGIIGLWIMLITTNQVPEFETEPTSIVFHITIECIMGIFSILCGLWLFQKRKHFKELILFTNGLLGYSVVNSSGYYVELGEYAMIIMFTFILLFTLYSCWYLIKNKMKA